MNFKFNSIKKQKKLFLISAICLFLNACNDGEDDFFPDQASSQSLLTNSQEISNANENLPVLQLPIEVLSDGKDAFDKEVILNISEKNINSTATLAFTCHRCTFVGAPEWEVTSRPPTKVKASLRILGALDNTQDNNIDWIEITESNVKLPAAEKLQGGLGINSLYTTRIELPITSEIKSRLTSADSGNRIQFRFNGTEGESNGYRIIKLSFLDEKREKISTNPIKYQNIEDEKNREYSLKDIYDGEQLWKKGQALNKSSIVNKKINASCASCHAAHGRDLQYFNYSNNSIIQRARFHGLSEQDGAKLAAYIRSNKGQALHVPQAAPWNPPYQPGPGLDKRDVREWAAGAGLEAVIDSSAAALNALFGANLQAPQVKVTQKMVDDLMDPYAVNNTRETATSLQMPDWNAWLPAISPEDAWPDGMQSAHARGSFNTGARFSADDFNQLHDPKGAMQRLTNWLEKNKSNTWGDWSHLTNEQRNEAYFLMQNSGWAAPWMAGGGRSNHMATGGKKFGGEVAAANFMKTLDPIKAISDPRGTSLESFVERAGLSLAQWSIVQQWDIVQTYGLESNQKWFIPTWLDHQNKAPNSTFNGMGEDRGWALQTPGVFWVAPHMIYQPSVEKEKKNPHDQGAIFEWDDWDKPIGSHYRSNIWYDLAMVLNAGAARQYSNYPVDWNYHPLFSRMLTEGIQKINTAEAIELAKTHALREIQVITKLAQQGNNNTPLQYPLNNGQTWNLIPDAGHHGRAGALLFIMPASWILASKENEKSRFEDLNKIQGNLYNLFVNGSFMQFNRLLGIESGHSASEWRRCDPSLIASNGIAEPYFSGRFCLDKNATPFIRDQQGIYSLKGGGMNTTSTLAEYSFYMGQKLNAEPNRLSNFNQWLNEAWPDRFK